MLYKLIRQLLKYFYPLFSRWLPYQVYAYLAVGAANTIFNISLFAIVYNSTKDISSLAVEIATVVSFTISAVTGFWLNKHFAFTQADNEKRATGKQFTKYVLIAVQGQISAYLLTKGMVNFLLIDASVAYLLTAIIMLTINYFLQKHITFRKTASI